MEGISRGGGSDPLERDKRSDGAGNAVGWAGGALRVRALLWGGAG